MPTFDKINPMHFLKLFAEKLMRVTSKISLLPNFLSQVLIVFKLIPLKVRLAWVYSSACNMTYPITWCNNKYVCPSIPINVPLILSISLRGNIIVILIILDITYFIFRMIDWSAWENTKYLLRFKPLTLFLLVDLFFLLVST